MRKMNTKKIVRKYLKDNGYDGLYHPEKSCGSGCSLKELAACGELDKKCVPGYRHSHPCRDCSKKCKGEDWIKYLICGKKKKPEAEKVTGNVLDMSREDLTRLVDERYKKDFKGTISDPEIMDIPIGGRRMMTPKEKPCSQTK